MEADVTFESIKLTRLALIPNSRKNKIEVFGSNLK